jgi:hypothetical protein
MLSKKQLFTRGMLDISPHMLSVIPLELFVEQLVLSLVLIHI